MDEPSDEQALATRAAASEHFRVDMTAMSYAELRAANKLTFPISAVMKLLRVRGPVVLLVPLSTSLERLEWDSLPGRARSRLRTIVDDLAPLGFDEVVLFTEDWRAHRLDCMSVALLDADRTTMLLAMYTCLHSPAGMRVAEHVDTVVYSVADHGRVVMTRSSKYPMRQPPEYDAVHLDERPAHEVADAHAQRLAASPTRAEPYRAAPWTVIEAADVPALVLSLSQREAQFQIERGVYVSATSQELAMFESPVPAKRTSQLRLFAISLVVFIVVSLLLHLL